jgi:hypothetical protein
MLGSAVIWIALFYLLMSIAHVVVGYLVLRRHENQPWFIQGLAALICGAIWPVMSLVALRAAYDTAVEE